MLSNNHAFTSTGKIKRPSYSTVTIWVKDSCDEVSDDLICRSFKCCRILTNPDGSEDKCLFDYDSLLDPANDDDEVVDIPNDQENADAEEYPEENNYINDWNIEKLSGDDVDNDVDDSVDNDNGNKINILDNRGKVDKGKKKEEDEENLTTDDEELNEELLQQLNELKEKYKKSN
jgi:hypothetical protein